MQTATQPLPNIDQLSQQLKLDRSSLMKTISRMNLTPEDNQLPEPQLKQLVMKYTKNAGKRSVETVVAAQNLAVNLNFIEAKSLPTSKAPKNRATGESFATLKSKAKQQKTVTVESILKSKTFLLVVLICALSWQVMHTAGVVARMDQGDHQVSNYLFAFAIQFTALLMTIHGGGVNYLRAFAVIEFLINMAYYRPWHVPNGSAPVTLDTWIINVLLSFTIAFTIFCYSKLLTSKK